MNVLCLQRTLGNRRTAQAIQRDSTATPAPRVAINENINRNFDPLADQPWAKDMLRRLVPLAQQAAQDFKQFRDGGYEREDGVQRMAQPALKLAEESKKTLAELKRLAAIGGPSARNQDEDSFVGRGMRDLLAVMDNAAYAHYLQSQLDSETLTLLQQARSFSKEPGMASLGTLFGLPYIQIEHRYDLTLRTSRSWMTIPHEVIIRYSNNIGMSYEKELSFRWLGGGAKLIVGGEIAGKIKEAITGQFQSAIDDQIEGAFGIEPSFDETTSSATSHTFWLPSWFELSTMTELGAYTQAEYKHVLAKGLPSFTPNMRLLSFDYKAQRLTFDLSSPYYSFDPKLPELRLETIRDIRKTVLEDLKEELADIEIDELNIEELKKGRYKIPEIISGKPDFDADIYYKRAVTMAHKKEKRTSDPLIIDLGLRHKIDRGKLNWQPFVTVDLFFDTGSSMINAEGFQALELALHKMREYLSKDPQAALRFIVIGKASRAWKQLQEGESAAEKNQLLSQQRAERVLSYVQQLRPQILGDLLPALIEDMQQAEADPQISDSAEGMGATDDAAWSDPVTYKRGKSRKRSMRGKNDNTGSERGASLRVAVRPTPLPEADPDAALKQDEGKRLWAEHMAEIAQAQVQAVLNRFFSPDKKAPSTSQ
ncbi:MAG: hypothetical protein SNJ83_14105, partial [Aggregatilineales bacterium]